MSDLRKELAENLKAHYQPVKVQAETCESVLLDGLKADVQVLAMQGVQMMIGHVQDWIQCRFSGGSQPPESHATALQTQLEASGLLNDVKDLALACATENFSLIFSGGIEAFLAAVAKCVASKLLGGIGGGGGGIFKEQPVGRCPGQN